MRETQIEAFQDRLGYSFQDPSLLELAFVHRSVLNERPDYQGQSNERLEFLGDAVLEIIVTDYLFHRFPKEQEGALTRMRSEAVCEASFAKIARKIGLSQMLVLGHGEAMQGGRDKDSLLADSFEALAGAIYLDGGEDFLKTWFLSFVKEMPLVGGDGWDRANPKSALQTYLSRRGKDYSYELLESSGPDHHPTFLVALYVEGREVSRAKGASRKKAEALAASKYLEDK